VGYLLIFFVILFGVFNGLRRIKYMMFTCDPCAFVVGWCKLKTVEIHVETAWYQPLKIENDEPVSKFVFTFHLRRYNEEKGNPDYPPFEPVPPTPPGTAWQMVPATSYDVMGCHCVPAVCACCIPAVCQLCVNYVPAVCPAVRQRVPACYLTSMKSCDVAGIWLALHPGQFGWLRRAWYGSMDSARHYITRMLNPRFLN